MGFRAVWLIPGALALPLAVAAGCSAPDPDAIELEPGHSSSRTGPDFDGAVADTGSGGSTDGSGTADTQDEVVAAEGGTDTGGGSADGPTLIDSAAETVFGSTAYTNMPVTTSAAMLHSMKGGPANPSYKADCMTCHNGATKGTAEFLFAGSIFGDADGGVNAAGVEVRVVDSKGKGYSAYSDANGDFWFAGTAALSTPGQSGARNAVAQQLMPSALATGGGGCNSCHNGTNQELMHLP